jgi:hypothetical protein
MLRTPNDIIEALRARKEALGLSNATVDELSGYTDGWFDKVAGPTRIKPLPLATLMAIAGALGYAVQFVEDPDTALRRRWTKRRHEPADNGRLSRLRRARGRSCGRAGQQGCTGKVGKGDTATAAGPYRHDECDAGIPASCAQERSRMK